MVRFPMSTPQLYPLRAVLTPTRNCPVQVWKWHDATLNLKKCQYNPCIMHTWVYTLHSVASNYIALHNVPWHRIERHKSKQTWVMPTCVLRCLCAATYYTHKHVMHIQHHTTVHMHVPMSWHMRAVRSQFTLSYTSAHCRQLSTNKHLKEAHGW